MQLLNLYVQHNHNVQQTFVCQHTVVQRRDKYGRFLLPNLALQRMTLNDVITRLGLQVTTSPPSVGRLRCFKVRACSYVRRQRIELHCRGGSHLPLGALDCLATFGKWFNCVAARLLTFDSLVRLYIPQGVH